MKKVVQTTVEITGKFSVELRRKTPLADIFQSPKTSGRKGLPKIPAEKSRELQRDMHIAFVDFTKAYDTVNQNFSTISYPMKFIRIIKELNTDVHAKLIVCGDLTRHFWVQERF